MSRSARVGRALPLLTALLLAGCVSAGEIEPYKASDAGFADVAAASAATLRKDSVWIQNRETAEATAARVHGLVHKKTIGADTAVQVALLNNRGLQAAYAEIGISAADVWQESLLENPKISIGMFGIGAPGLGAFRSIEGMIANNILRMATARQRIDLADTRFRQAQLRAILETLRLAAETRRAWISAVGAFETVYYLNQAQAAADAASELAQKLGESGALPKAGQAREHAFFAELTGQKAQAKLAAQMAKENLTRLMGLWGQETVYYVPDRLPGLPRTLTDQRSIEAEALKRRVDLQLARLELEAVAKANGLTQATRYVSDLELLAGFEAERELEDGERETTTTPQVELEFTIPIFDSGAARQRKGELAYMRAANMLAEKAVNIRSEARSAYTAYRATYDIARHYQRSVVPLRAKIEEESLLTYNGMITNTFELLADTRAKIGTILLAANAKRDFWLAEAAIAAAVNGGGSAPAGGTGGAVNVADAGSGEH